MFWRSKKKGLVGLDVGSSAVKAVELAKHRGGYELVTLGVEPLGPDTVVDGAIMDALSVTSAIEKIFIDNNIQTRDVATSISGHSVIVKKITVDAADEAELQATVPYVAQQHLPFDISDVNLSYQSFGESASGGTEVILVAVKREKILNHTNVLSQARKAPSVVDYDGFAVFNAFEANYDVSPINVVALLNIGASIMNIVVGRGSTPLFARDVSVGGNQYTDTLQKELDLSYADAERLKLGQTVGSITREQVAPHLRSVSDILIMEVQKTFDFFHQTNPMENPQAIFLAGGTARIGGLAGRLAEEFRVPVEIMDPFSKIKVDPAKFDTGSLNEIAPSLTVAVGLGLRSFD